MPDKLRPVIPEKLIKPLQRYATAHNVNLTAAVSLLLTAALRQGKYISLEEMKNET
ncbi:MAG: hypothetical protein ACR2PS_11065 [Pseudomonadales bacterium]